MPRASILWLAPAVKVERSFTPHLHLDRLRSAKGMRLGITLGVCMSGLDGQQKSLEEAAGVAENTL